MISFLWFGRGGSRIPCKRRRRLSGGRQHKILLFFPKNCMKSRKFCSPPPLRSATVRVRTWEWDLGFETYFCQNWVSPFWNELEFVKLVKGKYDHQYDLKLHATSSRSRLHMSPFDTTCISNTSQSFDKFDLNFRTWKLDCRILISSNFSN